MAVIAVLIVALILGLVLGGKGDDPIPPPVPPVPPTPVPIDSGYNIYYLNDNDTITTKNLVSGVLSFNTSYINNDKFLEKTKKVEGDAITIQPGGIPIGDNN